MSEGSDKVFHVYPTNPTLQRFGRVKIVQSFFKIYRVNQSILEKIFFKKSTQLAIDGIRYEALEPWKPTEDIKETFKKLTQQLNNEIDLCKKDLQQHLEKKGKVDLIFKSLLSLSVENERIVV